MTSLRVWWSAAALLAPALVFIVGDAAAAEAPPAASGMPIDQMVELLKLEDVRVRNAGDYKALVYIEQKERDKTDIAREAVVYRRDTDQKLMILFSKPKSEEGKGYLRLDKTLWSYDPNVGKWERRTDRERIAGTDSRRADFDQSRLAEEYDPAYEGQEKLGVFTVDKLGLKAKDGVDVAYPIVKLWIDKQDKNILKRQEFALSGKLMRTLYYPKWEKVYSESKKGELWYSKEIRIYDEIEKGNSSLILIRSMDLRSLQENLFTKAWLEAQSR